MFYLMYYIALNNYCASITCTILCVLVANKYYIYIKGFTVYYNQNACPNYVCSRVFIRGYVLDTHGFNICQSGWYINLLNICVTCSSLGRWRTGLLSIRFHVSVAGASNLTPTNMLSIQLFYKNSIYTGISEIWNLSTWLWQIPTC